MQTAQALSGNATTFLTHIVGRGLADDRYVAEKYKPMVDGDIRPVQVEAPKGKGRRKAEPTVMSLKTVKEMRPARTVIIICTCLSIRNCGVRYGGRWPWACSPSADSAEPRSLGTSCRPSASRAPSA